MDVIYPLVAIISLTGVMSALTYLYYRRNRQLDAILALQKNQKGE